MKQNRTRQCLPIQIPHITAKIVCLGLGVVMLSLLCTGRVDAQLNLKNVNPLPSERILSRYGLEMVWWGQATIDGARDRVKHVSIDERSVVVESKVGILTMFDAETGQKVWVNRVGRPGDATFMPAMNERLVLVASGIRIYAIDRATGRLTWQVNLDKMPSTGPTADENRVYVGTLDGSVYAYDLRKIKELYQERLLPAYTESTRAWRYQAGKRIISPPLSTGRSVLFASLDNSLYAVSARARRLLFQFESDGAIAAPLVMHDQNIYFSSTDYNFYCLNANNGQVRWSFLSGVPITRAPHVIEGQIDGEPGDIVYVLPELAGVSALSARTGRELWDQPQTRAVDFLTASNKILYTTDKLGNTLLIDRQNGEVIGVLPTVDFDVEIHNDRTDRLFLARQDGLIVMIREIGTTFPKYHQYPERRPILPELYDPEMAEADAAAADAEDTGSEDELE